MGLGKLVRLPKHMMTLVLVQPSCAVRSYLNSQATKVERFMRVRALQSVLRVFLVSTAYTSVEPISRARGQTSLDRQSVSQSLTRLCTQLKPPAC